MRQRRGGAYNSPTSTICYDDVETCCSIPIVEEQKIKKPPRASSRCSKLTKRLVALALVVTLAIVGYSHCRSAYTLYNLPGVQELLKEATTVIDDDYVVFLTASTGEPGETHVKMGRSARSATYALMQAQAKLAKLPKKFPWIKIDVVDEIKRIDDFDYFDSIAVRGDWFGVALDWNYGWAFLPDEVQAQGLLDKESILRWEKIASYARIKKLKGWPIPDHSDDHTNMDYIDIFHTSSVFYDLGASIITPVPLFHGHRLYPEITPQVLETATVDAGEYMAVSVEEDNTFMYNYMPRSDFEPSGYNLTRHAAAIYALSWLYSRWDNAELLEGIKKAMTHLLEHVQPCSIPHNPTKSAKCVVEQDDHVQLSKLGINALTVLAIAEYTQVTMDKSHLPVARELATWIGGAKREDGSFVHRVNLPSFELDEEYFSREYHGQVGFALSRLYNVVKSLEMPVDEGWLDVAAAATAFQVSEDEEDEEEEFVIDHWLLYAIGELPSSKRTPEFVEHAMRSVHIAADHQNEETDDEDELDELGLFFGDLSATATAAKTEGLCAVYQLAVEEGRKDEADAIVHVVNLGLRHQLQVQWQPEHALYMKNPKRILGGFHESIIDTEMRLDHTYHNLCSLLCTADMMAHRTQLAEASKQE